MESQLISVLASTLQCFRRKEAVPRRMKVLRCPENGELANVDVDSYRALSSVLGTQVLRVQNCSLWPARKECTRGCLGHRILEYLV
jgi:hypothetical protein